MNTTFVQSPIIASICLANSKLGKCIEKISASDEFKVSVYMDDIIVSSDSSDRLTDQIKILNSAAERSKLPLNIEKQEGPGTNVTAFNIHLSKGLLEITSDRMKRFDDAYSHSESDHQKEGIRNYIASVNFDQSDSFF